MSLLPVDTNETPTGSLVEHPPPTNTRDSNLVAPGQPQPHQQQQPKSTAEVDSIQTGELKLDVVPTEDQAPGPPLPAPAVHPSQQQQPPPPPPPAVIERPQKLLPFIKPIETAKTPTRRVSPFKQTAAAAQAKQQPTRSADGQRRPHRAVTFVSPAASSPSSSAASVISQHRHAVFSSEGPPASVAGMGSQIFFKDCWVCCCECPVWVGLFVFLMICLMFFISFFFWPKTITMNEKPNTYFMQPVDQHYDTVDNSHDFVRSEPIVQTAGEPVKYS